MKTVFFISFVFSLLQPPPRLSVEPYSILHKEWKAENEQLKQQAGLTRSELRQQMQEINSRYTPRFRQLAEEHAKNESLWIYCLIWMSQEGVPGPDLDAMFDFLGQRAPSMRQETHQLALLMSNLIRVRSDRVDPALIEISEKHRDSVLRGTALYALAARTKKFSEEAGDLAGCTKAEQLLERVLKEYPDSHTYEGKNSENATLLLDELRSPIALGKIVPPAQGKTISGEEFYLKKTIAGKVAVLSFSGHWCGPCVAMHPVQKEIMSRFPASEVVIVEINSDQEKNWSDVRKKNTTEGLNWIVVADGGSTGPITKQWNIQAWPTYVLIDANAKIRRRVVGNVGNTLIDWVDELVKSDQQ